MIDSQTGYVPKASETSKAIGPVVDLFAGCGGLSMGFANAGFQIVGAFDAWKPAVDIYNENFDHPAIQLDLGQPSASEIISSLAPGMIIGGPPCQDFSPAGHRDESLGRADLTISFARIVADAKPKLFVMENVPRIRQSRVLAEARDLFKGAGYGLSETVLNAALYGVPQARKRFFLVGQRGGEDGFFNSELNSSQDDKAMTLRDYFGDSLGFEHYFRVPRTYARRGVFSIDEPAPTVRGVDRPVPSGYPGHPKDSAPISEEIRTLTQEERAMIQTFPRGFKLPPQKSTANELVGNAVPVKLAEHVAKSILRALSE